MGTEDPQLADGGATQGAASGAPQPVAEAVASPHVLDLAYGYLANDVLVPCPTGFAILDKHLCGGFIPSGIYTIAGGTGVGKSSLILAIAQRLAFDYGKRVVYLSLEMTGEELIERAICQSTRKTIPQLHQIREAGQLETLLKPFLALCKASKFRIEDQRKASLDDLEVLFDEMRRVGEPIPDVLVIDHVQQQSFAEGMSRTEAVANYMGDLKDFAKRYRLIVLLASQINREGRKESRAESFHLKQSSAIEENSDVVLLCHREDLREPAPDVEAPVEPVEFKLRIAKHRRGPRSELTLMFHPDRYAFDEPESGWTPKRNTTETILVV